MNFSIKDIIIKIEENKEKFSEAEYEKLSLMFGEITLNDVDIRYNAYKNIQIQEGKLYIPVRLCARFFNLKPATVQSNYRRRPKGFLKIDNRMYMSSEKFHDMYITIKAFKENENKCS